MSGGAEGSDWAEHYVLRLLSERLEVPESSISPSMPLSEISFDSLDIVEFLMGFEDDYGADVPDEDVGGIETVQDLIEWVRRHGPK